MTVSLRKLAIRLACIHAEDRQWILEQLPPAERQQLDELLQEVSLLGLAADPSIVDSVMQESRQPEPSSQAFQFDQELPPFWLALLLQTISSAERRPYFDVATGTKSELLRWNKEFSIKRLPSGLLQSLKAQLENGGMHVAG